MNQRIKELWLQAGGHYSGGNQHTWPEYTITDPEKFADLIVKECTGVLLKWKCKPLSFDEDLAAMLIKQHIGIEQ